MATENNTEENNTEEQNTEDIAPEETTEAEAAAAKLSKKKAAGLGVVAGLVVLAVVLVFALKKSPPPADTTPGAPKIAQTPGVPTPPGTTPAKPTKTPPAEKPAETKVPVVSSAAISGTLTRPGQSDWVKGVEHVLKVPNGLEATPGLPGSSNTRVRRVGIAPPPGSHKARLKQLWKKGAAAKHRGDYAGARKAWQKILQLSPNHPGIQEAIDKLPG